MAKRSPVRVQNRGARLRKITRDIEQRKKQVQALELRKAGATYQQIADQLGFNDRTGARRLVAMALDQIVLEPTAEYFKLQVARGEKLLLALWPQAMKGDPAACREARNIWDGLNKLHALYPKQEVELTGPGGGPLQLQHGVVYLPAEAPIESLGVEIIPKPALGNGSNGSNGNGHG